MSRRTWIMLMLGLLAAGCTQPPPLGPARKAELRQLLSPKFDLAAVPPDRIEDLYQILDAFAAKHRDELIRKITFESSSRATINFSWSGGFHGGVATAEKRWGKWRIEEIVHFV